LFEEIDVDGNGVIDRDEFRLLLQKLNLQYENHKFQLIFRAIDSGDGNGTLQEKELGDFFFPPLRHLCDEVDQALIAAKQHVIEKEEKHHQSQRVG
jgi:hypothetical protein